MIKFSEYDAHCVYSLKDKIRRVHEYLFYNAKFESQIKKYKDEYAEYGCAETKEQKLEELADMFISACGIQRFDYTIGSHLCDYVLGCSTYKKEDILVAVTHKMNELQTREWEELDNGYYQHKVCNNDKKIEKRSTNSNSNK